MLMKITVFNCNSAQALCERSANLRCRIGRSLRGIDTVEPNLYPYTRFVPRRTDPIAVVRRKIDSLDFNGSNFSKIDTLVSLPCRQGRSRCRQGSNCFLVDGMYLIQRALCQIGLHNPMWFNTPPGTHYKKNSRNNFSDAPDQNCIRQPELQDADQNSSIE